MAEDSAEKTEPASEKRRQEFRDKGEVARSKDVISVLILFSGVAYFMMFGRQIYVRLGEFLTHFFTLRLELEFEIEVILKLFIEMIELTVMVLGPLVVLWSLCRCLAISVGVLFTVKPLTLILRDSTLYKVLLYFFNKQAAGNSDQHSR